MRVSASQSKFLGNDSNKTRFIDALKSQLEASGIQVIVAVADADVLISRTALQLSRDHERVGVVCDDTDILVLLITLATNANDIYLFKPGIGSKNDSVYDVQKVRTALGDMCQHLLIYCSYTRSQDATQPQQCTKR